MHKRAYNTPTDARKGARGVLCNLARARSVSIAIDGIARGSFSFKDSVAVGRTFPAAGSRAGGSDAFASRITNGGARRVTSRDEDRRLNHACRLDTVQGDISSYHFAPSPSPRANISIYAEY